LRAARCRHSYQAATLATRENTQHQRDRFVVWTRSRCKATSAIFQRALVHAFKKIRIVRQNSCWTRSPRHASLPLVAALALAAWQDFSSHLSPVLALACRFRALAKDNGARLLVFKNATHRYFCAHRARPVLRPALSTSHFKVAISSDVRLVCLRRIKTLMVCFQHRACCKTLARARWMWSRVGGFALTINSRARVNLVCVLWLPHHLPASPRLPRKVLCASSRFTHFIVLRRHIRVYRLGFTVVALSLCKKKRQKRGKATSLAQRLRRRMRLSCLRIGLSRHLAHFYQMRAFCAHIVRCAATCIVAFSTPDAPYRANFRAAITWLQAFYSAARTPPRFASRCIFFHAHQHIAAAAHGWFSRAFVRRCRWLSSGRHSG